MHQKRLCRLCGIILLMLQKSYSDQPLGMDVSNPWVNNGIPSLKLPWHLKIHPGKGDSYWKASFLCQLPTSTGEFAGFLNHQQYHYLKSGTGFSSEKSTVKWLPLPFLDLKRCQNPGTCAAHRGRGGD